MRPRLALRRQHGLSIVELLVGVVVGLFVVGGAIKLTVDSLGSNRRLLLETRVNQDMRAAADLIARDLRRASYWENAITGLWSAGAPTVTATNLYAAISGATPGEITYSYQRPLVAPNTQSLGFRRVAAIGAPGQIEMQNGSEGWQVITDSNSIDVTAFTITETVRAIKLWQYCSCRTRVPVTSACEDAALDAAATPQMNIREYVIAIQAQSRSDPAVQRELRETVRVRNDQLLNPNGCPGV
jgi:prepilin peptidase dependent protein B